MHRFTTIGLACLALAFVAGCGDDSSDTSSTPAAAEPAPAATTTVAPEATESTPSGSTVKVGMKDIKFVPEEVTAKVGQKILWTNNEDVPHNVTATDGADFASDTLQKDATYEYTPTAAGTIKYVCTIHSGQNGQITVTK